MPSRARNPDYSNELKDTVLTGNVSDLGGKVVASRRQNRARQLEDTLAGRILYLYRCHSLSR
jgi:hypothetical protein